METSDDRNNKLAWHYTSTKGLLGIISTHSLWATSAAFLNDYNELKTSVTAVRNAFDRLEQDLTPDEIDVVKTSGLLNDVDPVSAFLVSASKHSDLLSLWRNYGKDTVAYSIGFDRSKLLHAKEQKEGASHPCPPPGYFEEYENDRISPDTEWNEKKKWENADYVPQNGDETHEQYLKKFLTIPSTSIFGKIFHRQDRKYYLEKDVSFKEEAEIRIVTQVEPGWKYVKLRESKLGIVPYIELVSSGGKLPIQEIKIGPTSNQVETEAALRLLLDNNCHGDVRISVSKIPFRNI